MSGQRAPGRLRAMALVLAAALALTGCGGGGTHATRSVTSSASSTNPDASGGAAQHYSFRSDALVTMRQYSPESLLWQTISINPHGSAVLTTLIGEQVGAEQRRFQLPARQAAAVRRLVAGARGVRPPRPSDPRAELYTLHIAGQPAANLEGPTPPRLTALVVYLSNLMLNYCC